MARVIAVVTLLVLLAAGLLATRHEYPVRVVHEVEELTDFETLGEVDVLMSESSFMSRVCSESENDRSTSDLEEKLEHLQQQAISVLEASADAEHLLVAAVLTMYDSPEHALPLLGDAASRDPRNPLIASYLLEFCTSFEGQCSKPRTEMEQNLITADRANGLAWALVAKSRLERSDEPGALAALAEAAAAASVDDYIAEYVLLFDRGLAASTNLSPYDRLEAAFGFAAAMPGSGWLIYEDCKERGEQDAKWLDVCLRIGERFEHDGRSLIVKSIGLALQTKMYEFGGDARQQQLVAGRHQEFRRKHRLLGSEMWVLERMRDATVMRKYLETFAAADELAAMQYVADEVQRRLPEVDAAQHSTCPDP